MNQHVSPRQTSLVRVALHTSPSRAAEIRRRLMGAAPIVMRAAPTPVLAISKPQAVIKPPEELSKVAFEEVKIDCESINARGAFTYLEAVQIAGAERLFLRGVGEAMRGCTSHGCAPKMDKITRYVLSFVDFDPDWVFTERRYVPVVRARHVIFYIAREYTRFSLPTIGRFFGKFDHTTVLHGARVSEVLADVFGVPKHLEWRKTAADLMAIPIADWQEKKREERSKKIGGRP